MSSKKSRVASPALSIDAFALWPIWLHAKDLNPSVMTDVKAQIGSCNGRGGGRTKMEMSAQEGEWELPMVDS